jgi:oxygen-independent coproporphyrinogen-3 oxidase
MSGIYLHIPFCKQACHYCDFHFSTSLKKKDAMISALKTELVLRRNELKDTPIETIYFGGGTPSILSVDDLQLLIHTIYENYSVIDHPEITLEANPDDLMPSRAQSIDIFQSYRNIGINRLSIGIQSFFEDDLKTMNRAHNAQEAKKCLSLATRHFDNITIDLIYGIPNMSLEKWEQNLQMAFDFGVPHISSYALTVEAKTALDSFIKKGTYPSLDENLASQHFEHLVKRTQEEGFVHYEISNFGKSKYLSKHNTSYWQGKSYLGIGPSAHSFNGTQRSWNIANNSKYIKSLEANVLPSEIETLTKNDRFNEYVMTGLRTIWGISLNKVEADFGGIYKTQLLKSAQKFIEKGLLVTSSDFDKHQNPTETLKTTSKGKFLADGIAADMFILN